jgi:hypothetical protein
LGNEKIARVLLKIPENWIGKLKTISKRISFLKKYRFLKRRFVQKNGL